MVYVPDTHAIVWFLDKDPRLSPAAKNTLANPNTVLIVPTIVLVEITHLYGHHQRHKNHTIRSDSNSLVTTLAQ